MSAETIGLLAYGLRPAPLGMSAGMLASGAYTTYSWELQMERAHAGCHISSFCRNPLHPGPCKGWKHHLGLVSPGALHALEKVRHEKLEEKRKSKVAALLAEGKKVPNHLQTPIVYDPTKNPHIANPDKITPGLGIPTKGLTPETAKATLDAIPTKEQVGAKLDAKHAAEAAAVPKPHSAPVYTTIAKAGLKDGDQVFLHGKGKKAGEGQLVTVHKYGAGNKTLGFSFKDTKGNDVMAPHIEGAPDTELAGGVASKWHLSPAPGKSFPDHGVPAGPSGFEKGEQTKMDALHKLGEAQTKANSQTDAFVKMASLAGGKHLSDKEKAAVHAKFAGNNQEDVPKAVMPQGSVDSSAKKIAAKLWLQTSVSDHAHQADLEAALAKDITDGVEHGEPTPVLDAARNALLTLGHSIPGSDKALADAVHKKLGIPGHEDTPSGDLGHVETALGAKLPEHGLSIADETKLSHVKKTLEGKNNNLPMESQAYVMADLPKHVFDDHLDEHEQKAVLSHLATAHAQLAGVDNKSEHQTEVMKKVAAAYENLSGKPLTGGNHLANVSNVSKPSSGAAPHVQEAIDYANGSKSGTDTKKFMTYKKLTKDELGTLDPNTKNLMVANLEKMKTKFIDPKKVAAVLDVLDKIQSSPGGGAGAGGGGLPLAEHHASLAEIGASNAHKLGIIHGGAGTPAHDTMKGFLEGIHNDANLVQAEEGWKKLGEMHADKMLKDAGVPKSIGLGASTHPVLASEITKALKGGMVSDQHTPLVASLMKSDIDNIDPFIEAVKAHPQLGPGALGVKQATESDPSKVAFDLSKHAGINTEADKKHFMESHPALLHSMGEGDLNAQYGHIFGQTKLHKIAADLGLGTSGTTGPEKLEKQVGGGLQEALSSDYEHALNNHKSEPDGLAGKVDQIASEANAIGDSLVSKNGWPPDSQAVKDFKAALFANKVKEVMASNPGAGGHTSHTSPAAAASNLGAVSVPDVAEVPQGEEPALGGGDGIGHLSQPMKDKIGETFHSLPFGTSTSDPIENVFDNLVAVAGWHGNDAGPLSVLQAAQVVDEAKAKKYNSPNKHLTEKALLSWLGTKDGKEYAAAYNTPKADQIGYLKDPEAAKKTALESLKQIQVAQGHKVQTLAGGPGAYDPAKPSSDFHSFTHAQAQKSQDDYMAKSGEKWTGAQKQAITAYTGSKYVEINDYLRKPDNNDPAMKKYATQIQAGMRPLAHDQLLLRGSSYKIFPPGFQNIEGVKKLVGEEIADTGFVSTSIAGSGGEFTKAIKLHIEAPVGTMAAYVRSISSHPHENEMILAAGTKFRILSVDTSGHQPVVRLRVVS